MFESNGAGVAGGDLNGDGLIDLAFANLDGPDTILWNMGQLQFRTMPLDDTNSRAVAIVDVDGDTWLDVAFTHRGAGLSVWQNQQDGTFQRRALPGVLASAYTMAWADLNGDSTLDLVTGSYDAETNLVRGSGMNSGQRGGVFVYTQQADGFTAHQLASTAQALSIALLDLDDDQRTDILVGNDFDQRDAAWVQRQHWQPTEPFQTTTHSTMGFAIGDLTNDGHEEVFATDMKPYSLDTHTLATWLPLMAKLAKVRPPGDPQTMENVLHLGRAEDGARQAAAWGVSATGWSWSAQFGDLDEDGWLDLVVANGMIASDLFPYLPNGELVEQNQAFRNQSGRRFLPAPAWGLGSSASGRGMLIADLDNDGDLDIVINNLRAPAEVAENALCGGKSLSVDLRQADGNTRAIGARVILHTSAGRFERVVRAEAGYLSGASARVHIGFPATASLQRLDIVWPDGATTSLTDCVPDTAMTITRT